MTTNFLGLFALYVLNGQLLVIKLISILKKPNKSTTKTRINKFQTSASLLSGIFFLYLEMTSVQTAASVIPTLSAVNLFWESTH